MCVRISAAQDARFQMSRSFVGLFSERRLSAMILLALLSNDQCAAVSDSGKRTNHFANLSSES